MKKDYDRSKMQHKDDILRFEWGNFPAIGINHFEQRREERTKSNKTDIFGEVGLSDELVLKRCFKILEIDKYQLILDEIKKNKPKETEFIVAFETDETAENGRDNLLIFFVFSISIKETAMNGIEKGKEFLSCITIVKDTYKKKHNLKNDIVEVTLGYYKDESGVSYHWRKSIPRI